MKTLFIFLMLIGCCTISLGADTLTQQLREAEKRQGTVEKLPWGNRIWYAPWGAGLIKRGEVGYSPVIMVLPQGTNFGAAVSVSADRRYITFGGSPMFSSIAQWSSYNISNGQTIVHKK